MQNVVSAIWYGVIVVIAALGIAVAFAVQPATVSVDIVDPRGVQGAQGRDDEGVWFTGDAQIASDRFIDTPWRIMAWRWRQAPGDALPVTLGIGAHTWQTATTLQWRRVQLLLPASFTHTPLSIQSPTLQVAGDTRQLGVMLTYLTMKRIDVAWWWWPLVVFDYVLPLGVAALWLWRGRLLGAGALLAFATIHVATLWLETRVGFAQASLLVDRGSRYALCGVMLVWAWLQQRRPEFSGIPPGRRFGLDVFRAIAVLCVAITHFTPLVIDPWVLNKDFVRWERYIGALGVDIFFALSGYLIGVILLRMIPPLTDMSLVKRFWMRRWLRTLPAAYVSAAVAIVLATPQNWLDFFMRITFVSSLTPYYHSDEMRVWWSLASEEYFYLVFPLLLLLWVRLGWRHWAFGLTLGCIALLSVGARFGWLSQLDPLAMGSVELIPYVRLDPMVFGAIVAWIRVKRPTWFARLNTIGYAPGMVLLWVGFMLLLDKLRWMPWAVGFGHTFIGIGAALIIPAVETLRGSGMRWLDRSVIWIAAISYSMYLYHDIFVTFLERQFGVAQTMAEMGVLFVVYSVLTLGASWLSYRLVEQPVLAWRDTHMPDPHH
ncbi:MAG: acyltransferase family protein [Roseiflexaceae bacterium]|jgi:peptidoglycan/LPS O-acetylase OafA/YrhL